jgi:Ser/Thr protein kinase RdoA (MazF antagonist)
MDTSRVAQFAQARARQALRTAGLPEDGPLHRASSTRNEVFVGDEFVVRVNRQPDQRLRREAQLCEYLPDAPWAPRVVAYGGEFGADFLIVRRLPGAPLGRCWPDMTLEQRRSAISQLCAMAGELHSVRTPVRLPPVENLPYLIDPRCVTPLVPMLVALDQLRTSGVDRGLIDAAEDIAHQTGDALADYDRRQLIHGDLTFENLLWDGTRLSGVLDFEWCRGAPIDMELDVLLRVCALPFAHVAEDYEDRTLKKDYAPIPSWLCEFRPDLFAHPRIFDRLRLYCMAFDIHDLILDPPTRPRADLGPLHPLHRLRNLVDTGGHLQELLSPLGISG